MKRMNRRDFSKSSLAACAALGLAAGAPGRLAAADAPAAPCTPPPFPETPGLTKYVGEFIVNTRVARHFSLGRSRWSLEGGLRLAAAGARSARGASKLPRQVVAMVAELERAPSTAALARLLTI